MGQVRRFGWAWLLSAAMGTAAALSAPAFAEPDSTGETPETLSLQRRMFELIDQGKYSEGLPLAERRITLLEPRLGPDSPKLAGALAIAARYRRMMGDFRGAEPLYLRALAIIDKTGGASPEVVAYTRMHTDGLDFASTLEDLAALYREQRDYARAEDCYQRLIDFWKAAERAENTAAGSLTPRVLDQLGALYEDQQDYARAEDLFSLALADRKRLLLPHDMRIAASLRNLGSLFRKRGDAARAEPPLREALAIVEQESGPEAREVADIALELAKLYASQHAYAQAEPLLRRALAIRENDVWGTPPTVVAETLADWARICADNGDLKGTEERIERARSMFEKALGPSHRRVAECLFTLSDVRAAQGRTSEAIDLAGRAEAIEERDTENLLTVGSEAQKRARLAAQDERTSALVSLHAVSAPADPAAARLALTTILHRKGRILDAMADSFSILRSHQDPAGQALLDQLALVSSQLSAQTSRGPGEIPLAQYRANLEQLTAERQRLEGEIGHKSAEFRADRQPVTVEQVKAAIPGGAALLEIFAYRPRRPAEPPEKRWGAPRYAAYVLPPSGALAFADLGEVARIDAAVARLRKALDDPDLTHLPTGAARALDALMMQPIRPLLGGARRVFLSADSALTLVPFAALAGEDGRPLIERFSFTYLTSGRDLLRFTASTSPRQPYAILLGDPAFGDFATATARMKFGALPGTGEEARAIARIVEGSRLLLGSDVSKAALRALRGPRILHIATNGFFLPSDASPKAPAAPDNPLLRAGLALAGANNRSSGGDGILTALEAAALDLYGTRLVVLSACETGLGDATLGDGVYGLRRALVIAGAETQVLSLWKVKDAPTQALMKSYYQRLLRGDGRSEALRQAALEMLARPATSHPTLWASFIVSGNDATLDGAPAPPPPLTVHARGCGCHVSAPGDGAASAAIAALICVGAVARRKRKA